MCGFCSERGGYLLSLNYKWPEIRHFTCLRPNVIRPETDPACDTMLGQHTEAMNDRHEDNRSLKALYD